ncbi:hypothetical protein GTW51_11015 [Aurantimonas aggregata]|uniref:Tripartite tricarboxylate transporter permease n=1 Tax=Aurantimonas aggregata TaxID=2047720 RepID=A0A6L9MHR3_9HYPH|nr:hypothetical protein [Aurantimonas aggregata]
MLGFGLLGFAMERLSIPTAPAVLAVILGPLAEASLRRSLLISRGEFGYLFQSPISLVLIAVILLMIGVPLWRIATGRRKKSVVPIDPEATS